MALRTRSLWFALVAALALVACGDASPEATAVATARPDGLAGAPVPSLVIEPAEFDDSRLDAEALAFPPLTNVGAVPASEATWLQADTLVLGAVQGGEARAYPLFIMQFHHVANDVLGGEPYLVTF
jgi:hypothetical protein